MDTPPPDPGKASDMPRGKGCRVQGTGYRGKKKQGAGGRKRVGLLRIGENGQDLCCLVDYSAENFSGLSKY